MLLGEQGGLGSSPDFPPRKAPGRSPGPAVPNLFLASGTGFVEDDFSTHWGRVGSGFQDDSRVLHLLCTLFLFLLHQLPCRSSGDLPEIPPSSREEGLRLLHGLATNLATSLQTPQEA